MHKRVNQRDLKEDQEDVKIIDVPYIKDYVVNQAKPVNEDSLSLQNAGLTRAASSYYFGMAISALHHGRTWQPAGFGAYDLHVLCVFLPPRDKPVFRQLRGRFGPILG